MKHGKTYASLPKGTEPEAATLQQAVELLDAQDTSLTASAAAAESLYNFLITIMSLQRAVGGYDFLLTAQDRSELAAEFRRRLAGINR